MRSTIGFRVSVAVWCFACLVSSQAVAGDLGNSWSGDRPSSGLLVEGRELANPSAWSDMRGLSRLDRNIERLTTVDLNGAIKTNRARFLDDGALIAVDAAYTGVNKIAAPLVAAPYGPAASLAVSGVNSLFDRKVYGADPIKAQRDFGRNAFVAGVKSLGPYMRANELRAADQMGRLNTAWNMGTTLAQFGQRTRGRLAAMANAPRAIDNARFLMDKRNDYLRDLRTRRIEVQNRLDRTLMDSYKGTRFRWPR